MFLGSAPAWAPSLRDPGPSPIGFLLTTTCRVISPAFVVALLFGNLYAFGQATTGSWELVTPTASFSPRDSAEDLVFDGKMWLSNGYTPPDVRDLWSSPDGKNWNLVAATTPYDAYSEMVVFAGKMWAIKSSVWNSTDGINWTQVLAQTPFGTRGYGEVVVYDGKMWQLGSGADVWYSTDGIEWICATQNAAYGDRFASAVTVFDGKIWLMGGATYEYSWEFTYPQFLTHNDVWSSVDGVHWNLVMAEAPWAPRMWFSTSVYLDRIWIIAGFDNRHGVNFGDVWYTEDGITWNQFLGEPTFAPRHAPTSYVYDDHLWVVAGNWPLFNDVWRLTPPSLPPVMKALTISKLGTGDGTVYSNPPGIDCGPVCSSSFVLDSVVTLSAVASPGSIFVGWTGGGCSGPGTCDVAMTQTWNVTATFVVAAITPSGPTTFCTGGSVTLTASPGDSYLWSTGATTQSINVATSGSYSVTLTVSGCTGTSVPSVVTVNPIPAKPTIIPSSATTFCAGGSVTLTSSASSSYLWSTGATTQAITVLSASTYWVRVTDANGCQSPQSDPMSVTVYSIPPAPTITIAAGYNPGVFGSSITLDAGAGYDSYLWSTGVTSRQTTVSPPISTTYTVIGTRGGCNSAAGSFTRNISSIGGSADNPGISCKTLHLANSALPDGLYWLDPNGGSTADAFIAYCDMTVDGGGWTLAVNSVTGSEPPTADAAAVNGTAGLNSGHTINATDLAVNQVAEIRHRIEAASGKVFDAKYTAHYHEPLASWVNWTALPAHVAGSDVLLNDAFASAWEASGTCATTYGTPWYYGNPTCVTSIPLNVMDGATQGPINTAGETLTRYSIFVREVCPLSGVRIGATGETSLCAGTTGGTATVTDTGGGTSIHQWGYRTNSGGSITSLTGQTGTSYLINAADFGGAGTFYLVCTTTPTCGSPATSNELTITIDPIPAPTITPSGATTFCAGGTISLTASTIAGATYAWTGPGGYTSTAQNPTIPNATTGMSGTYSMTVTVGGCTSVPGATSVTVNPLPAAPTAGSNGPLCVGATLNLTASTVAGATYAWTGPNGFTSTLQNPLRSNVTTSDAGVYSVTVTVNGCTSPAGSMSVAVNATPLTPVITAPSSVSPNASGITASVVDHAGSTFTWGITNGTITAGTGSNQITFTAGNSGSVSLTMIETSAVGCASAQASVSIPVTVVATRMFTTTPCRLFDTRNRTGPDAADPVLAAGETRTFTIGGRCSVPSSAKALSVNQTVTGQTANGELLLYRGEIAAPTASSVSFAVGKTRANNGILELARDGSGTFKVWNNSTGTVHFILDVNGYFQ